MVKLICISLFNLLMRMFHMKKSVNHLAPKHEQNATLKLPFQEKFQHYQILSQKIQQAWYGILPQEALTSLQVAYQDDNHITITTNHHTLANHLNYNKKLLLETLKQFDPIFNQVMALKFQVNHIQNALNSPILKTPTQKNLAQITTFSDSTKQNIAHLAELVIHDKELYDVLQKILDETKA